MKEEFIENFKEALEMEADQQLSLEDKFRDLDDWDSLARLSLIAMLDEEYEVEIEEEEFEKLTTVSDVMEVVQKKQS